MNIANKRKIGAERVRGVASLVLGLLAWSSRAAEEPSKPEGEFVPQRGRMVLASGEIVGEPKASEASPAAKTVAEQIDAQSRKWAETLPVAWLSGELAAAELVRETDAFWARYLELVTAHAKQLDSGNREKVLRQKTFLRDSWLKKREALLIHLKGGESNLKLQRFDGGKDQAVGYALVKGEKPYRSLVLVMNRPDPALGDAELPLPSAK